MRTIALCGLDGENSKDKERLMADKSNKPEDLIAETKRRSAETPGEKNPPASEPAPREIGGRDGPDPTRYGDWEKNGRCIDF